MTAIPVYVAMSPLGEPLIYTVDTDRDGCVELLWNIDEVRRDEAEKLGYSIRLVSLDFGSPVWHPSASVGRFTAPSDWEPSYLVEATQPDGTTDRLLMTLTVYEAAKARAEKFLPKRTPPEASE